MLCASFVAATFSIFWHSLAAVLNAKRGASKVVLLTQLGGGAFGNHDDWIHAAMRRSLEMMWEFDLDVRLVTYGAPSRGHRAHCRAFWSAAIDDVR